MFCVCLQIVEIVAEHRTTQRMARVGGCDYDGGRWMVEFGCSGGDVKGDAMVWRGRWSLDGVEERGVQEGEWRNAVAEMESTKQWR